jgi:hypothetical protein
VLSYRHITQRLKLDSFTPSTGCVNINKNYTQKGEVRGEAGGSGIWLVLGLDFELQEARRQPIPKNALHGIHGSVVACIYLFQFNFGNFCRKLVKQATALYVHSPLLKTPLRFNDESEVKTIFALKFDSY